MRFGEVTELRRRKDFDPDCTVVTISRAVTHRADPNTPGADPCRIDSTKNGEERTVTIPPHIREDVKSHLAQFVHPIPTLCYSFPFAVAVTLTIRYSIKTCSSLRRKMLGEGTYPLMICVGSPGRRTPRLRL